MVVINTADLLADLVTQICGWLASSMLLGVTICLAVSRIQSSVECNRSMFGVPYDYWCFVHNANMNLDGFLDTTINMDKPMCHER